MSRLTDNSTKSYTRKAGRCLAFRPNTPATILLGDVSHIRVSCGLVDRPLPAGSTIQDIDEAPQRRRALVIQFWERFSAHQFAIGFLLRTIRYREQRSCFISEDH